MRTSTIVLSAAASLVSAQNGQNLEAYSEALASISADPAYSSLVAYAATADVTSLYSQAQSYAASAIDELSQQAATATGTEGAYLSGLYTSAVAALSSIEPLATSALNITAGATGAAGGNTTLATGTAKPTPSGNSGSGSGNSGSGSGGSGSASDSASASGSDAAQQTGNGAAATAVPVVMGAVAMAALGLL